VLNTPETGNPTLLKNLKLSTVKPAVSSLVKSLFIKGVTSTRVRLTATLLSSLLAVSIHSFPSSQTTARGQSTENNQALQAFTAGNSLAAVWEKDSLKAAIDKFMEAAALWRSSRSPQTADALRKAADIYVIFGDHAKSLELNNEAIMESERNHDLVRKLDAIIASARNSSQLGENESARSSLERVLRTCDSRLKNSDVWKDLSARAHNALGEIFYAVGTPLKSVDYFKRAIELSAETGNRHDLAQARLNLGYAFSNSGSQNEAGEQFKQAAAVYSELGDERGQALCLTAKASLISLVGKEQESLDSHNSALKTFRKIGDLQSEGVTLCAIGQTFENLGQTRTALDKYEQSLELFQGGVLLDYATVSEYKIGRAYRLLGEPDKALAHYQKCLAISRKAKKKRFEAYALKDIAEIYAAEGKPHDSLRQYQKVLSLYRTIGDLRGQGLILNTLGDFFGTNGKQKTALSFYQRALPLFKSVGDRDEELSTLLRLGKTTYNLGNVEEALTYAKQSVGLLETLRNYLVSPDMRLSYFSTLQQHYELYIKLLMESHKRHPEMGFDAAALEASESARARTLVEILAEAGTSVRDTMDPQQLERQQRLQQTIADKERLQLQLTGNADTQSEAAQVAREVRQLIVEEQAMQAQMRLTNPDYSTLVQPQPLNLKQVQAELKDEDTVLLEFFLGEQASYLWAVTADSFNSYILPPRVEIETLSQKVYELLTARQDTADAAGYQGRVAKADQEYQTEALALSNMLFGPVATTLGRKRLLIVADGMLEYIPFAALPRPTESNSIEVVAKQSDSPPTALLENELINLPSVSALAALRKKTSASSSALKMIAVFADPVFSRNDSRANRGNSPESVPTSYSTITVALRDSAQFGRDEEIPRLPHTRTEADRILGMVASDQSLELTDFAANRTTLFNPELQQFQIVHFATHALIDSEHPRLSGIFLSTVKEDGKPQNGFITMNDVYNLKLSTARVVVLSACSTGLGKDVKGEGLIGLTRGFMHAGSKSVVASLWKVDDRATATFMNRFYSGMLVKGLTPAAALKDAKLSMQKEKRWEAPYYWAGFVLHGEYREPIIINRESATGGYHVAAATVFLAALLTAFTILRRRRHVL
jgi:CHAT domain-containing protein